MAPAHSTAKVGDITLPEGWKWSDDSKDTVLADGVAVKANAVYTGADKGNYENVSVTITITRSSCDHKNTEVRDKKKVTCTKKGTKIKDNDGSTYIVTSGKGKTPTVQYTGPKSTAKGTVTIPAMVKVDGVSYRVTSIADNAFKNNKKITRVVIGSNIVTIGKNAFAKCTNITSIVIGENVTKIEKNAFYGCGKLKKITIKSEKLTSKSVAKNAFSRIGKKTVIKVPTSKYKAYKKMLYTKGLNKKVRILKY